MFTDPDGSALLQAVAAFLETDVRGAVSDPRLSFRVLIAAHLCRTVAAELKVSDAAERAELERLLALTSGTSTGTETQAQRREKISELQRSVITQLPTFDDSTKKRLLEHLQATLKAELAVTNPRFDLSMEIE